MFFFDVAFLLLGGTIFFLVNNAQLRYTTQVQPEDALVKVLQVLLVAQVV